MNLSSEQLVAEFGRSASRFPTHGFQTHQGGADKGQIEESMNSYRAYGEGLYEKYAKYIGDMPNGWSKTATAMCMESWNRATKYMSEATQAAAITNFNKNAYPLIRAVLPATATEKAFTIQPMLGPTSQVFVLQPVYGTKTSRVNVGDPLWQTVDPNYGDSQIDTEQFGTGTGAQTTWNFTLSSSPVVPGTFNAQDTDSNQVAHDDSVGNIIGDATGTINYATGAVSLTWNAAPAANSVLECGYSVDNETDANAIPEIDLVLSSFPVTARRKAIRFRYSLVANYALQDQYGIDAQVELTQAVATEIAYGIDLQNFKNVTRVAINKTADNDFTFDATVPSGVTRKEHYESFIHYLIKGSDEINRQSGRVYGTGIVADSRVVNICRTIGEPRFKPTKIGNGRGIQEAGMIDNQWLVLSTTEPQLIGLGVGEYMIFSKMDEFLYAGYVWSPWIAAYETPLTVLDDFQGRKGMASLYGSKVVNAKYYLKAKVKNL